MVKVTVENKEQPKFPRLMQHTDGAVVLFTNPTTGTCVLADDGTPLGYYCERWGGTGDGVRLGYGAWKDFAGSLTLSNEG